MRTRTESLFFSLCILVLFFFFFFFFGALDSFVAACCAMLWPRCVLELSWTARYVCGGVGRCAISFFTSLHIHRPHWIDTKKKSIPKLFIQCSGKVTQNSCDQLTSFGLDCRTLWLDSKRKSFSLSLSLFQSRINSFRLIFAYGKHKQ